MGTLILRQFIIGYNPERGTRYPTWITAKIESMPKGERLSITAVEGPKRGGNCWGSCGQAMTPPTELAPGIDATRLYAIWERWHLNDMRPGCEHQRSWDTTRKVEVVEYWLTSEARKLQKVAIAYAAQLAAGASEVSTNGVKVTLTATERALIALEYAPYAKVYTSPDADSPLSGCYEVYKRETKAVGWIRPEEHPDGLLCKPCPECGYKYGSAWLFEPLPADVVDFITALPHSNAHPWGQR